MGGGGTPDWAPLQATIDHHTVSTDPSSRITQTALYLYGVSTVIPLLSSPTGPI